MSETIDIEVKPLSPALGAEIRGVNLARVTPEQVKACHATWLKYQVILLRDQKISEEEQVRFGELFGHGQLSRGHISDLEPYAGGLVYVTNVGKEEKVGILPDGEMQFHSDQCYREEPSSGTMLYAMEVPSKGGNTMFANCYKAYETLPAELKQRVEGRKALNVYDYNGNPTKRGAVATDAPSWAHPIVRTHNETGRKSLFINRLMTARIEELPADESDALLTQLFNHIEKPEFIYSHEWRPGDVLIWDNRCVLHARTDFDSKERRMLRRITLRNQPVH